MRNIERAKEIAKAKGISFAYVCKEIGKSSGYLSEILARERDIPEKMLAPVANALCVSIEELTGEQKEKAENGFSTSEEEQELLSLYRTLDQDAKVFFRNALRETARSKNKQK